MDHPTTSDLDITAMGSAFVELTPDQPAIPLSAAAAFVPLAAGAAANFAGALAALGVSVGLITRVGADELGRWLIGRLAECGVNTDFITAVPEQLTPVSFCWADQSGAKTFYFYRCPGFSDPLASLAPGDIDPDAILRGKLFDFTEATIRVQPLRDAALHAASLARAAGRTVCYAVNYRPGSWAVPPQEVRAIQQQAIAAADLVVMNEEEARFIFPIQRPVEALAAARALGPSVVLITSGEAPTLVGYDGDEVEVPSYSVAVQYDVGAGDAFHAGFIAGYLRGLPAPGAAQLGAAVAALKISHPASAPPPTWPQVQQFLGER